MTAPKRRIGPILVKWFLLLGLGAAGGAVYHVWQTDPQRLPLPIYDAMNALQTAIPQLSQKVVERVSQLAKPASTQDASKAKAPPPKPKISANQVTLHLRNGGVVTGALVERTSEAVTLRWEYGDVTFQAAEIARIVEGRQVEGAEDIVLPKHEEAAVWPYTHDVVFRLMNGTILDTTLHALDATHLHFVQELEGGGLVEQAVPRADLDQVMFRPLRNERSQQIRETLQTVFPKMRWEEEGLFTIVTDSAAPTSMAYRRTIRELATEWYLTFYPMLKERLPKVQQHIVVFENWDSYIEYAATDGVPGWVVVGYFHPQHEVLYCFNMVGERFSDLLYGVYLGQFREARDRWSQQIKGSRYEVFIEGQISEFLQKLEQAHAMIRQLFNQLSVDILRHELTHAMFHSWQLQSIVLSQMPEQTKEEIEKKRQYLQTASEEEKRRLLDELLSQQSQEALPEMQAANSWFVEGLAGFMEPSPIGGVNQERLAQAQEARRQNQILPLEFLNAFRMGSFVGMAQQSALYAYAQSWALCHFLMQRYPDGFLVYLKRLAREHPEEGQDTLPWLMEAIGKEQRTLEQEFLAHLDQFPPEDPFWMKQMQVFLDLRQELITLAARLGG